MVSDLLFCQLVLLGLLWLCIMLHYAWPSDRAAQLRRPSTPSLPSQEHCREPNPFAGLTHKPHCEACEQAVETRHEAPGTPPPRIIATRGRRRQVDISGHFCPHTNCAYQGWVGFGNFRANGHPSRRSCRQL
jgi:hypothetical protein